MKINFGKQDFWLDPSGVLFWPDQGLLVVADLHLEKSSHFAQRGFFLPPYDSAETLERLRNVITTLSPRQILILGDCFHDALGFSRLSTAELENFEQLLTYEPLWIRGNHDGDFVPPGFTAYDSYELSGITFSHEATENGKFEISGHFHPKVDIVHKGAYISRPCFIENGNKMILPSFGAYTGGLSVDHASIGRHMGQTPNIYIKGDKKIYYFDMTATRKLAD